MANMLEHRNTMNELAGKLLKRLLKRLTSCNEPDEDDLEFFKDCLRDLGLKSQFDQVLEKYKVAKRAIYDAEEQVRDNKRLMDCSSEALKHKRALEIKKNAEKRAHDAWLELNQYAKTLMDKQVDLFINPLQELEEELEEAVEESLGGAEGAEGNPFGITTDDVAGIVVEIHEERLAKVEALADEQEAREDVLLQQRIEGGVRGADEAEFTVEEEQAVPFDDAFGYLQPVVSAGTEPCVPSDLAAGLERLVSQGWKGFLFSGGRGEWEFSKMSLEFKRELAARLWATGDKLNEVVRLQLAADGIQLFPPIDDKLAAMYMDWIPALKVLAGVNSRPFKGVDTATLTQAADLGLQFRVLEVKLATDIKAELLARNANGDGVRFCDSVIAGARADLNLGKPLVDCKSKEGL
jgi:hypothetical protein